MKVAPMGWNSWDCYGAAVNEEQVKQNADYMAKYLKDYGWEYVVVDIQWSEADAENNEYHPFKELCMDEYGRLIPSEKRFPSSAGGKGFAPLAEYVHSLGLKFGIHIMRGVPRHAVHKNLKVYGTDISTRDIAKTASICAWNTDMYGVNPDKEGARLYYDSIFSLYASWGVDFIKCDDICRELPHEEAELVMLSNSLKECGREMILSLSPGPALLEKAQLYKEVANMWRITDDFWDDWKLLYAMFERAEKWSIHAGYGHWPDADMLPIGALRQCYNKDDWTKFTNDELITMMTLWSIMRSPLFIGGEMTKNDEFTLSLLTNKDILDMHSLSRHAHQVWRKEVDGIEHVLWVAASADGATYFAVFNLGESDSTVTVMAEELEIDSISECVDLWDNRVINVPENLDCFQLRLNKHGAKAFKLR